MKQLILIALLFVGFGQILAQSESSKKQKRVVTIEKSKDKDGNEVIEKKILEGDAVKKDMEWNEKGGSTIKITSDSMGHQKKIIINSDIDIEDDDNEGYFENKGASYTERTVVIKKNADGSVEIKEKSGSDLGGEFNLKVDSTEAKKPNIGVTLNDDLKITSLIRGGAAEIGGLESGDLLTHLDGTFIDDYDHLKELLSKKQVGDKVTLTYLRDRKEMKSTITLKGGSTRIYFNK